MGTRRKAMVVPRTGFHQRRAGSMELRRFAARPLPLRELPQPLPLEITPLSFLASTSARRTTSRHFVGREFSCPPPISKPMDRSSVALGRRYDSKLAPFSLTRGPSLVAFRSPFLCSPSWPSIARAHPSSRINQMQVRRNPHVGGRESSAERDGLKARVGFRYRLPVVSGPQKYRT